MPFPVDVIYDRRLKSIVTDDNAESILSYIRKSILEDKADNVSVDGMTVIYSGSASNWRGSLYGGIDGGKFSLIYRDDAWYLIYHIGLRQLFIFSSLFSLCAAGFMFFNNGPWWVGIIAFLWLGGFNWVISYLRHGFVATDIAAGIDKLISGEPDEPESEVEDKMTGKLKSWF
ncbi:hypothetical protein [Mucilaginibacter defluvii]|uniref:2TM domain-containing protein n=1 Tax=Mucilaginibacter defluvii TaxID=1196019 RepID=A0ABP9FYR8_9SPHI